MQIAYHLLVQRTRTHTRTHQTRNKRDLDARTHCVCGACNAKRQAITDRPTKSSGPLHTHTRDEITGAAAAIIKSQICEPLTPGQGDVGTQKTVNTVCALQINRTIHCLRAHVRLSGRGITIYDWPLSKCRDTPNENRITDKVRLMCGSVCVYVHKFRMCGGEDMGSVIVLQIALRRKIKEIKLKSYEPSKVPERMKRAGAMNTLWTKCRMLHCNHFQ